MTRVGIFCMVAAVGLGILTYIEGTLAFSGTEQPELISLKDLIARGPDGNTHLLVKDLIPCDNFVYAAKKGKDNAWTKVWVPVVPGAEVLNQKGKVVPPDNIQALIFSTKVE